MKYIIPVLLALILIVPVTALDNISVYSYGSNFVIWDVGNNTDVYIDGVSISVLGTKYGQYELTPNSEHVGCNTDGNCTGIVTKTDSWFVFQYWGVYLVLIGLCIISYRFPITAFPSLIYGIYLITIHLPNQDAGFNEYSLTGVLMIMSVIASIYGYRRLDG